MTRPRSIIGALGQSGLLRHPGRRRSVFAALLLGCALLTYFPERYRAAVTMTPSDPATLGLGGALGQLGALNTVFGNQAAVEISLKIGRSVYARQVVMRRLGLVQRLGLKNETEASRWLERNVEIRSLRGGIVQVETFSRDPRFGEQLVAATADAMRDRLSEIQRRQTGYKREVLGKLVSEANEKFAEAEARYNDFRLKTRYSDPGFAIDAIGQRIPVLQAAIKVKEVELNAARQFATDENMSVRQIIAEIDALRKQLAQFQALSPSESNSIGQVVRESTQAEKLERELLLARTLYYNYRRFLEGTTVEDLTSTATTRVLEAPFIDTGRQINLVPLSLGIVILLIGLAIEFYNIRPPVGGRRLPSEG